MSAVGRPLPRADAVPKVTGSAPFTAEHDLPDLLHGAVVGSAVAAGRVRGIETSAALAVSGVVEVITPATCPSIGALPDQVQGIQYSGEGGLIEMLVPMQDDRIYYAGQAIAVVVAESLEAAHYGASLVEVDYDEQPPEVVMAASTRRSRPQEYCGMEPLQVSTGDVRAAFDAAEVQFEETYQTPVHHHNAIETLCTIAAWEIRNGEEHLLIYDTTRVLKTLSAVLSQCLDVPEDNIRVVVKFLGGMFGAKAWMFGNVLLAAACARALGRPLKIEWTRHQMFTNCGHRPATEQTIRFGALPGGRLESIEHEGVSHTSMVSGFPEPVTGMTMVMYDAPNLSIGQEIRHLNLPTPTPMRGVGILAGGWALESAVNELADGLDVDPVELRLINHSDHGPLSGLPFSSKHLRECYARGQEIIGWDQRRPSPPDELPESGEVIGFGVASSQLPAVLDNASARATLFADGTARVRSATHEIGNGAWTVFRQIAADALGMEYRDVLFELGDSTYPDSPITAGSRTTASVGAAVLAAGRNAVAALKALAGRDSDSPLFGLGAEQIEADGARLCARENPDRGETFSALLSRTPSGQLTASGGVDPSQVLGDYEFHSFGAIFAEIRVDVETGVIRVNRLVGVFDVGRLINPRLAHSQLSGGLIHGLGAALTEESIFDPNTGLPVTRNLADYHIPACADTPEITVEALDIPDPRIGELGARGLGEIACNNVPAAIAGALFNATGKRLRSLPLTPDRVLTASRSPTRVKRKDPA